MGTLRNRRSGAPSPTPSPLSAGRSANRRLDRFGPHSEKHTMRDTQFRFEFAADVDIAEAQGTLGLSLLAAEGLQIGRAHV